MKKLYPILLFAFIILSCIALIALGCLCCYIMSHNGSESANVSCYAIFNTGDISASNNTIKILLCICIIITLMVSATILIVKGLNMFRDLYEDCVMHSRYDEYRRERANSFEETKK